MSAVLLATDAVAPVSDKPAVPFATVYITLTKPEHIQRVMQANTWKGLHGKATEPAEWSERRRQHEFRKAAELAVSAELCHQEEMREFKDQAGQRRKNESRGGGGEGQVQAPVSRPPRGQRVGAAGHGRTIQSQLPERVEFVELDGPQCPGCGLDSREFPGTEDSQVLEIEVQA